MAGLDLTFDQDGILPVSLDSASAFEEIRNVKLLPGGKVLISGTSGGRTFLQRRNADGSLDVNFNLGNISILSADPIITTDGKIIVYSSTQIQRHNGDGTLDTTFASGGVYGSSAGINELLVRFNPATKSDEIIFSERGGFLAPGTVTISFLNASGIITRPPVSGLPQGVNFIPFNPVFVTDILYNRANPNDAGIALTNQVLGSILSRLREELVPQNRVIDSISLGFVQADGSILVSFNSNGGSNPQFFAVRLNSNFQADTGFGTNGILKSSGIAIVAKVDNRNDSFYLVRPEAAGTTSITHYTKDGKLDPGFGNNGKAGVPDFLYTNSTNYKPFLDVDSQGRVVGGRIEDSKITLARLNTNGTLDTTIGSNGKLELPFDGKAVLTFGNNISATLSADDRLLVVGSTKNSQDGLIAKYDITGATPPLVPANNAPVSQPDTNTAVEAGGVNNGTLGTSPTGNVLTNDTDVDAGDTKTVSAVGFGANAGSIGVALKGAYGSLTLNADGSYSYAVDNSVPAVESLSPTSPALTEIFNYTVKDKAGSTSSSTLTIAINGANDAPSLPSINNSAIDNTAPLGAVVGKFTATDPDSGDSVVYSLITGTGSTDNDFFEIVGDELKLKNTLSTKSVYSIRVKVDDKIGLSTEQTFDINIIDVNGPPARLQISNSQVPENVTPNTIVGILNATTAQGNTLSYALAGGEGDTDNQSFEIVDNTLRLKISPDFESKSSYSVRIKATDQKGQSSEKVFPVVITNVNESPSIPAISNQQVAENVPIGSVVGQFTVSDPDAGDTFTYSLTGGTGSTDNSLFEVVGDQLKLKISPDFEAKSSYEVRVKVADKEGLSTEQSFAIGITNIVEPIALKIDSDRVFQFAGERLPGDTSGRQLSFQINSQSQRNFSETGLFKVDDNLGTINGIKPGEAGYLDAVLSRFQVISSVIPTSNLPQGFDGKTSRSLNINFGDIVRFGVVNDFSVDQLRQSKAPLSSLIISDPTTLKTTQVGSDDISFNWQAPLNLSLTAKIDSQPTAPLGTATQNGSQGELFDFRKSTSDISATFSIYREATFNNSVYIYGIQDETGSILDPTSQAVLKPTDPGYLQAALRSAVAGVNLNTANQSTTTINATLTKGTLFAPIIVINGNKEPLLDNNPNNDPAAYTPFYLGNGDKVDHIRLLGDNTFGFEDLPGGGDLDYNDVIVKATFKPIS